MPVAAIREARPFAVCQVTSVDGTALFVPVDAGTTEISVLSKAADSDAAWKGTDGQALADTDKIELFADVWTKLDTSRGFDGTPGIFLQAPAAGHVWTVAVKGGR